MNVIVQKLNIEDIHELGTLAFLERITLFRSAFSFNSISRLPRSTSSAAGL